MRLHMLRPNTYTILSDSDHPEQENGRRKLLQEYNCNSTDDPTPLVPCHPHHRITESRGDLYSTAGRRRGFSFACRSEVWRSNGRERKCASPAGLSSLEQTHEVYRPSALRPLSLKTEPTVVVVASFAQLFYVSRDLHL